jgi:hypothetical protein
LQVPNTVALGVA